MVTYKVKFDDWEITRPRKKPIPPSLQKQWDKIDNRKDNSVSTKPRKNKIGPKLKKQWEEIDNRKEDCISSEEHKRRIEILKNIGLLNEKDKNNYETKVFNSVFR